MEARVLDVVEVLQIVNVHVLRFRRCDIWLLLMGKRCNKVGLKFFSLYKKQEVVVEMIFNTQRRWQQLIDLC